jgi:hypothetical protein
MLQGRQIDAYNSKNNIEVRMTTEHCSIFCALQHQTIVLILAGAIALEHEGHTLH